MKVFASVLLASGLLLASSSSAAAAPDTSGVLQALLRKPKREFINGLFKLQREGGTLVDGSGSERERELQQLPTISLDLGTAGDLAICVASAQDVLDEVSNVITACGSVVAGLTDLDISTDSFELEDLAGLTDLCDNEDTDECFAAARELVSAARDAIDDCGELIDEDTAEAALTGIGIDFDEIEAALDEALLQQVICMDVAADDFTCAVTLTDFVVENSDTYQTCIAEFIDQEGECSDECTALAQTFVDDAGCCATGVIYSLNADLLMEVDEDGDETVEEFTACGVQLSSCEELVTLYSDNELTLPAALELDGEVDAGDDDSTDDSTDDDADPDSAASLSVTAAAAIVALSTAIALSA